MIVGACYMMLRRSYDTLNGFCPFFRVWGVDEQDLSARAWLAGLGVKCITAARVGHLCRPAFPYPVEREHLEFNEIVMLRSVFEAPTVRTLERSFEPVPPQVETWLRETDLRDWRAAVQSTRRATDLEFFRRVMPSFFWGFAGSR